MSSRTLNIIFFCIASVASYPSTIDTTANPSTQFKKAEVTDYKILKDNQAESFLDTTLTVRESYKHNYWLKDDFTIVKFSNMGHVHNNLTHEISTDIYPKIGFLAKKQAYFKAEDVPYYDVPTPLLNITYKTGIRQGNFLNALYTVSPIQQHNVTLLYKGLDSQGHYNNTLSRSNTYMASYRHTALNEKLKVKAHYISQRFTNEEHGGVTEEVVSQLEKGSNDLNNRVNVPVNLSTAENRFSTQRFFLESKYGFDLSKQFPSRLYLTSLYMQEQGGYSYTQDTTNNSFWGTPPSSTSSIYDTTGFKNEEIQLGFYISNAFVKKIGLSYNWRQYKNTVAGHFNQNRLRFFTDYVSQKTWFKAHYERSYLAGEDGYDAALQLGYNISNSLEIDFNASINNKQPEYNVQKNQSSYTEYNWENNFSNIKTQRYGITTHYKKILSLTLDYTEIKDHVYFYQYQNNLIRPYQYNSSIQYFRAKFSSSLTLWKFSFDHDILLQYVKKGEAVLPLSDLVSRSTIAFNNSYFFEKRLKTQMGVTVSYFSKYYMNGYNALISEFYTQNTQKIGNVPILDVFLNFRLLRAKIYLKGENINALVIGGNKKVSLYSAPLYPYRDFLFRFGFVWTFFR